MIDQVERAAGSVAGIEAVHAVRPAGWAALHVLVHAEVDPDLSLRDAHALGEQARHAVFPPSRGGRGRPAPGPGRVDEYDSHGETLHHRGQGSR